MSGSDPFGAQAQNAQIQQAAANEDAIYSQSNGQSDSQTQYSPTQSQDVVAVFDSNFNQLFMSARPIKASVRRTVKLMKHPVETGITITDHRIIMPIKISLSMVFDPETYVNAYNEVVTSLSSLTPIYVQTNVGLFGNLYIEEMPHEESPDHFDTITMNLSFEQVLFVTSQTSKLPPGSSKTSTGNKTAKPVAAGGSKTEDTANANANQSALHELFF